MSTPREEAIERKLFYFIKEREEYPPNLGSLRHFSRQIGITGAEMGYALQQLKKGHRVKFKPLLKGWVVLKEDYDS